MMKFKKGDRILRTGPSFDEVVKGKAYTVSAVLFSDWDNGGSVQLEGLTGFYSHREFIREVQPIEPDNISITPEGISIPPNIKLEFVTWQLDNGTHVPLFRLAP